MKYFTPELLARTRSPDDDVAEAAAAEWERAIAAYNSRLNEIRRKLPLGARQLLKHVSLHDARLLTIGLANNELVLTFRLPGSGSKSGGGLELRYTLIGQPELVHQVNGASRAVPSPRWLLYDELELATQGQQTAFKHSLLFADSLELRILFSHLRFKRFGRLLLADSKTEDIEKELTETGQQTMA
jgi:hypothetical protein